MKQKLTKSRSGSGVRLVLMLAVLLTSLPALAQTSNVSGTVKDSNGEGIAGVTVMVPAPRRAPAQPPTAPTS